MFVSLNWLRDFVDVPKDVDAKELGKLITVRTAEIDRVINEGESFANIVIGKITEVKKHPDADMLRIVMTDIGDKTVQIVCGGSNLEENQLVAVALPGAIVKWHGEEVVEIKVSKVRGVESHGMICASEEIGLGKSGGEREIMDLSYTKAKAGTLLAETLGKNDIIFEFDNKSLTHRPDLWGHLGIAREIAAITGWSFVEKKPKVKIPLEGKIPHIEVFDTDLCPRYMGLVIKNVKVAQSPEWIQNRLLATGHSIFNNIVDVTNFVMEEIGQPLHAFDLREIEGGIVVRRAKKSETIVTLDGEEKKLDENILLIADHKKALAIAGVMGGKHSGIQDDTVDILIESANFDPSAVRQASIKVGLRTDAVQRFEKSLDPKYCKRALLRAAELILELCPEAEISGPYADVINYDDKEKIVEVSTQKIRSKIGTEISAPEMADYLERLGFVVEGRFDESSQMLRVKVPSYRATKDINFEDDIVEEIARMHGYENIPNLVPSLPARAPRVNIQRKNEHDAREILAYSLKLTETYNYSFYSIKTIEQYGLKENEHIKLLNILSEDQTHMRATLIPNLVASLMEAAKFEESPAIFEFGRSYREVGEFMPEEKTVLAVAKIIKSDTFSNIKSLLEEFLDIFGVKGAELIEVQEEIPYAHPHQRAEIKLRGKSIGNIFVLHPSIQDGKIAAFEINFEALSNARNKNIVYESASKFPSIDFDISVLVDKKVSYAELEKALRKSVPEVLQKIELFDIYEGEKIDADKKSLAFRLTLQSEDRTLSKEDLAKAQVSSWNALEKIGGIVRKGE